jgi:hypothetical protein
MSWGARRVSWAARRQQRCCLKKQVVTARERPRECRGAQASRVSAASWSQGRCLRARHCLRGERRTRAKASVGAEQSPGWKEASGRGMSHCSWATRAQGRQRLRLHGRVYGRHRLSGAYPAWFQSRRETGHTAKGISTRTQHGENRRVSGQAAIVLLSCVG